MSTLLLVDRETRFLQELQRAVYNDDRIGTIECVEGLDRCLEFLEAVTHSAVSVLINVGSVPQQEALDLCKEISRLHPAVQVLVFGLPSEKHTVLSFIEAGADGYARGNKSVEAVLKALRAMQRGQALLCPDIAAALMGRIAQLAGYGLPAPYTPGMDGREQELTRRQREILELVRRGMTNAEIAAHLYIEVGTVKNHVHNVLDKLNVGSRHEAAALAARYVDATSFSR